MLEIQFFPVLTRVTFEPTSFGGKKNYFSKYKRKRKIFLFLFLSFSLIFFFLFIFFFINLKPRILPKHQIMGVKRGLGSSFTKFVEPTPSKSNKPLLEGDKNPSIEEQWIIPPFFEDYLFDKSLNWDLALCSKDPPYTVCQEPNDLLIIDMELKHIPSKST